MTFDFVIQNGHVIDPSSGMDQIADLAISDGKIAEIGKSLQGKESFDAQGCVVTAGLIDLHTHVYWGGTSLGVDPNHYMRQSAVTCCVDAGSAGPGNFAGFHEHIIKPATPRIFAYLHVSFAGIYAFSSGITVGESEQMRLLAPRETAAICHKYRDEIVGIKVRIGRHASGPSGIMPLDVALEVGAETGLPLMVHIDEPPPSYREVLGRLRKGDILTHCWRGFPNAPVDGQGHVREGVREAIERGVIFDIGHGMGSFSWQTAEAMMASGIKPDCISSDVHTLCMNGPARDLLFTMTKFMCLGMPLPEIIERTTSNPARAIGHPELGTLKIGAIADISVIRVNNGSFELPDAQGVIRQFDQNLEAIGVLIDGHWHDCQNFEK